MLKRILFLLIIGLAISDLSGQVTTSSMSFTVKSAADQPLVGASVKVTHEPTGVIYTGNTRSNGRFDLPNINPGGPYTIEVTFVGFEKATKDNIFLTLGEVNQQTIVLGDKTTELSEVVVATSRRQQADGKGGTETTIGRDKMTNLPTVGRNVSDFLRFVPQAKITGDGGVSIAGQNNRYNSFYIDGAVNNDVFGLAASGTNGGQAGIAPISMDAIDQFQVILSPYDATLGNFTGGGINATTRSGTNNYSGSVYYFFRNQDLSGTTPDAKGAAATKLADFTNRTYGFRVGGPIIKNKLFFFLNGEIQRDERPQPFDFTTYNGASNQAAIDGLSSYLVNTYGYDPGGYLDNPEIVEANRIAAKLDWNVNNTNKISLSYRYNDGFRNNVSRSSGSTINFYNNGYAMPSTTHSASAEWNSRFRNNSNNRLLLTLTKVKDDRGAIGSPFPRVSITDGPSKIYFGTEEYSTGNLLEQDNYALFDVYKFYSGKHTFSVGTDNEFSKSTNVFIRQNYGSYAWDDLPSFLNGSPAPSYNRSYSLLDDPSKSGDESLNAAAKFNTLRLGFFIGDEIKVNDQLNVTLGLRADNTKFLTTPREDEFFNDTALALLSANYDLQGARSGQISSPKWSLNPRIGFIYKMPDEHLVFRGGVGMFTGRVPLVWPGGVYNNNGISVGGISRSNVTFRADPFGQYNAADFGITAASPSGQVDLISKDFKMNKVFRTSLAVDKALGHGWKITVEGIFTKNINEIDYQNVSLVPPTKKAVGPDNRNVYDLSTIPGTTSLTAFIPLRPDGTSPYSGIYLLSNHKGPKGYAYNMMAAVDKSWSNGFSVNLSYTYGNSMVINEGTSSQNNSQWRYMETVNGRNYTGRSTSDFDLGHRVFGYAAKKFSYLKNAMATTISLVYNGQSGNPYSYVLNRGMVRDLDNNETNDLLFVPTEQQLDQMVFLSNTVNGITYTPDEQRELFNNFIEGDKQLRKSRGGYAERNGARLPFSNIFDLKIQQDLNLKIASKVYQLQLTYDVFNFTNMLNKDWGKIFYIANDQSVILDMAGFVSPTDLTPQYRFTPPTTGKAYVISDGVFNSARWTSQLGVRLSF